MKPNDKEYEVIFTYTRAEAIADGVLVDVSDLAREAGFKIPVAVTAALYEACVRWTEQDNKQTHQDESGRLWDVLYMLRFAINQNKDKEYLIYKLGVVPRDGSSINPVITQLKAVIGGGDLGEPVITIMLPDED